MIDIGYAGAFLGGVLTLLSPCSAILLPAFFAYAFGSPTKLLGRTTVFYAGLVTMLVPMGVAASSLGALMTRNRGVLVMVMSVTVIVLGVVQLLGVGLRLPGVRTSPVPSKDPGSVVSVYLLGTVYGVAGVCSGPILGSLLAVAAVGSDLVYGGVLLAVYALGMVVPMVVLAALWDRLQVSSRSWLRPKPLRVGPVRTTTTGAVSGALFIAIGTLLLATAGTANLGGLLTIDQQYAVESAVTRWSQHVSDITVVLVALGGLLVALTAHWAWRRRRPADTQNASAARGEDQRA